MRDTTVTAAIRAEPRRHDTTGVAMRPRALGYQHHVQPLGQLRRTGVGRRRSAAASTISPIASRSPSPAALHDLSDPDHHRYRPRHGFHPVTARIGSRPDHRSPTCSSTPPRPFDAPPDRVMAIYAAPATYEQLGQLGKLSAPELVSQSTEGNVVTSRAPVPLRG